MPGLQHIFTWDITTMRQPVENKRAVAVKGIWALFLACIALIPLSTLLGLFDTTTELFPTHPTVDQACFVIAAFSGLLAGAAAIYLTRRLSVVQRIMLPLVLIFEAAIGVFLVANHTASIVEARIDFPAGKSKTRQALIRISRAYQTHGKGGSQYMQTMPVWSNLEITREDFVFMQNNRRPGDDGHNRDEISSRGYFCARLKIEQYGHSVLILHAGSQKLPEGSVIVCPYPSGTQ